MHTIRFKPYVGENYHSQEFKVLVLGESHYLNDTDYADYVASKQRIELITQNVLNDYLHYKKTGEGYHRWMNTFTRFANVYADKTLSSAEVLEFWNSISFYNYVQSPMNASRQSPSGEDFSKSIDAFKQVVKELKPDIVFFWGYRLWNNYPKEYYFEIEGEHRKIYYLKIDRNIPFMVNPHPSSSSFNKSLSKNITDYIDTVKSL